MMTFGLFGHSFSLVWFRHKNDLVQEKIVLWVTIRMLTSQAGLEPWSPAGGPVLDHPAHLPTMTKTVLALYTPTPEMMLQRHTKRRAADQAAILYMKTAVLMRAATQIG